MIQNSHAQTVGKGDERVKGKMDSTKSVSICDMVRKQGNI